MHQLPIAIIFPFDGLEAYRLCTCLADYVRLARSDAT